MSKNKQISLIEGKRVVITEKTRQDATNRLRELRAQALSQGLFNEEGGAIQYKRGATQSEDKFIVVVTFNK